MAYTGQTAARPASLDGCWSAFTMREQPATVRSEMDTGYVKVRRRTTAPVRVADASVTLPYALYADFVTWWDNTLQGVLPTLIDMPLEGQQLWRFAEAPTYTPIPGRSGVGAFTVSVKLEQLPEWRA